MGNLLRNPEIILFSCISGLEIIMEGEKSQLKAEELYCIC